jgi:glycosyltransferase involved in cell wall biosynthesis
MAASRPLHILYLNQDFVPEVGAGPARILEMSRYWQEHGAKVTVVAGMPNRRIPGRGEGEIDPRYRGKLFVEEEWEGIRTLRSWVFASKSLGFGPKMINNASFMLSGFAHALAKAGRPDVIIASAPPLLPHITGAYLAKAWRVPLILELRDLWPDYLVQMGVLKNTRAQRALFALERWLLRQADHVVVVTDSFKERIVEKGVARERITVIPNGVDVDRYVGGADAPAVPPIPALERKNGEFIAGYLGTFGRGQALSQLVQAAAILEKRDPDVRIVLVGDGPDRDAIHAAIRETAVRNVTVAPPIPREATPAFYNGCDACLVPLAPIPIFQETIPSKIFEVMACARPLIASLGGEGAQIVARSEGGITTAPGAPEEIAAAIERVHRMSAADRQAMGERARAFATANYSRQALAERYLTLLRRQAAAVE